MPGNILLGFIMLLSFISTINIYLPVLLIKKVEKYSRCVNWNEFMERLFWQIVQ